MGPTRVVISAAFAVSVVAAGLASPAWAIDFITQNAIGTYEYVDGAVTTTWTATPCLDNADKCIRVTQQGDDGQGVAQWTSNAYWQVGWWTMIVDEPDALTCEDGTQYSSKVTYSWDAASYEGWRSFLDLDICAEPRSYATSFILDRTGPALPLLPAEGTPPS